MIGRNHAFYQSQEKNRTIQLYYSYRYNVYEAKKTYPWIILEDQVIRFEFVIFTWLAVPSQNFIVNRNNYRAEFVKIFFVNHIRLK